MSYKDWFTMYYYIILDSVAESVAKDEDKERRLLKLAADLCDLYPEYRERFIAERES